MNEILQLDSEITQNLLCESELTQELLCESETIRYNMSLAANGDFEDDTNSPPAQWTTTGDGGTAMGAMADATAPSGNNSAWYTQMSAGNPAYNVAINNGSPDVEIGQTYRISFWIKQLFGTTPIHIGCGGVFQEIDPTPEWVKHVINITAVSTQKLRFYSTGIWTSIYIDGIVIKKIITDEDGITVNSKITQTIEKQSELKLILNINSPLNN